MSKLTATELKTVIQGCILVVTASLEEHGRVETEMGQAILTSTVAALVTSYVSGNMSKELCESIQAVAKKRSSLQRES